VGDFVFVEFTLKHYPGGWACPGVAYPMPVLGRDSDSVIVDTSPEAQEGLSFTLTTAPQVRLPVRELDYQGYAQRTTRQDAGGQGAARARRQGR
jgi:hypothetical protein